MKFLDYLEEQNLAFKILLGFILIGAVGVFDFRTGYELAFSLFYVLPIALITWALGGWLGIVASIISSLVWFWADWASGHPYSNEFVPIWNTIIRLSFFLIVTWLLAALQNAYKREKVLAHTDNVTGAVNSRLFFGLLQLEIERFQRYGRPFTLVYIDLDNFKAVNDQYGHQTGDLALCTVVECARNGLRKVDVVARLGGDEFALLLPETNQAEAHIVIPSLQTDLLSQMKKNGWSITFSMGVVTCHAVPPSAGDLVKLADDLMYAVKRETKNAVRYIVYESA